MKDLLQMQMSPGMHMSIGEHALHYTFFAIMIIVGVGIILAPEKKP